MNSGGSRIWYKTPADQDWNRALPIGNGRLGAMIFGNVVGERVQLNEDTVWNGGPRNRINPSAQGALPELRRLLSEGRLYRAHALANDALAGIPDSMRCYEPLCDLLMWFDHPGVEIQQDLGDLACADGYVIPKYDTSLVSNYSRELNLRDGVARVAYEINGIRYSRSLIASPVDGAIGIRLEASKPGSISFRARLERGPRESYSTRYADEVRGIENSGILITGKAGGEKGVGFAANLRATLEGGSARVIGETLVVEQADSVTLYFAAATTFREADPAAFAMEQTRRAAAKTWSPLLTDHVAAFRNFTTRVELQLGPASDLPTDERLARFFQGESDPDLAALYFHFGRYLLISSSWPGSLPATLQGVWNQDFWPSWGSKYTININLQMNYWPVEIANLAECHQPLFDMLARMVESGRRTASEMYGCRGFVAHHNTDLWADTCPTDRNLAASYWLMGGAWLSLHLWEHFRFGGDTEFLRKAYPVLREASLFFLDFLIEDARGRLIVSPSVSPENVYRLPNGEAGVLSAGTSMDSQILAELFQATMQAGELLGEDAAFLKQVAATLERLPKPTISSDGRLLEWPDEYEETEPQHRHISHAFALYPGSLITPCGTPNLAAAIRKTLEVRGDEGTGWCMAWKVALWARLGDGEHAYQLLRNLLTPVSGELRGRSDTSYQGGGSYPNLFCAHPPFQIDGNFGGTAGIAEMLIQSHETRQDPASGKNLPVIRLLPALPGEWPEGSASGLRARGGFEATFAWKSGRVTTCTLKSATGAACFVQIGTEVQKVEVSAGGALELSASESEP